MTCDVFQILPNDGEIVFGEDVSLTFPSAPVSDETCPQQGQLNTCTCDQQRFAVIEVTAE